MSNFLRRTTVFVAIAILVFVALSVVFECRVRKRDNFFVLAADFTNPNNQPTVLFLGDSMAAFALRRARLPQAYYSFSFPGENLRQMYLKLRFALRTKASIRYLVLQVDDHVLSKYRAKEGGYTDYLLYGDRHDMEQVYSTTTVSHAKQSIAFFVPLLESRHRYYLKVVIGKGITSLFSSEQPTRGRYLDRCYDYRRYNERPWSSRGPEERIKLAKIMTDYQLAPPTVTPELKAVMIKLVALARSKGVKVIGVRYPLTKEYRSLATRYERAGARRFVESLGLDAILDYQSVFDEHPEYFNDPNHLYPLGAKRFTELLVVDLTQITGVAAGQDTACTVYGTRNGHSFRWPYRDLF